MTRATLQLTGAVRRLRRAMATKRGGPARRGAVTAGRLHAT
jgi:hypothetical protein